jgi:23S rRNA pseudouridine2605 synthase
MAEIRLNKFIASTGHCSRREADTLISSGQVFVNNFAVTQLGTKIDDSKDSVRIGKKMLAQKQTLTIALNKPKNIVCTKKATHGEKTIVELLPHNLRHLNPIGRLDKESQGLILLSNDGDFTMRLMHPRTHIEKEYEVTVKGLVTDKVIEKIKKGVRTQMYRTQPAQAVLIHADEERSILKIILKEGKKRQIREMMFTLGHRVKKLVRIRIGKYVLDPKLPVGAFMYLDQKALKLLES